MNRGLTQPLLVGAVTALVGFTSSFAVVLAGLANLGATTAQAASGLMALCVLQGVGNMWLGWRRRTPLLLAWSTPGAALLATQGYVAGGWSAAVGAFFVTGALIVVTGVWTRLGDLIAAIPTPIAQAMLAGVLVTLCLQPFRMLAVEPWLVAPLIVVWVVMQRVSQRWATPAAFALALVFMIVAAVRADGVPLVAPAFALTAPTLTWGAVVGLALPLFVVTMASQNVPGVAVMAAAGYRVPWRETMLWTGGMTMLGAPAGAHALNLAAITAALPASPEAHPDPAKRWIASASSGVGYVVLGVGAASLTALVAAAPRGIMESVAGLALLGTLATALAASLREPADRVPAVITMLLAASGVAVGGVSAAFWALLVGLAARWVLGWRRRGVPSHPAPRVLPGYGRSMTLDDNGPAPQSFDLESATLRNANYRAVVWSGEYLQVTLMSIPVGGDIGLEMHPDTDQFIRLDGGKGRAQMGPAKDDLTFDQEVSDGWCVLVPAGSWHNITNAGEEPMRLYTVYAPQHHEPGKIQASKKVADADESDEPAEWSVQPENPGEDQEA